MVWHPHMCGVYHIDFKLSWVLNIRGMPILWVVYTDTWVNLEMTASTHCVHSLSIHKQLHKALFKTLGIRRFMDMVQNYKIDICQ